jgi:hypothetical protein
MKSFITFLLGFAYPMALYAHSITVTISGTVGMTGIDIPEASLDEPYTIILNYDPTVADIDPIQNRGLFREAILSFVLNHNNKELVGKANGGDISILQHENTQIVRFRLNELDFPTFEELSVDSFIIYVETRRFSDLLITGSDRLPDYTFTTAPFYGQVLGNWGNPPVGMYAGDFTEITFKSQF